MMICLVTDENENSLTLLGKKSFSFPQIEQLDSQFGVILTI